MQGKRRMEIKDEDGWKIGEEGYDRSKEEKGWRIGDSGSKEKGGE